MSLGSMFEGLYTIQDGYPNKTDRITLDDSSLSIYAIMLDARGDVHHLRRISR